MDSKKFAQIVGRNTAWERMGKDSDKDGVVDGIDCEPHNPKKQGIIHDYLERRRLKKAGYSKEDSRELAESRKHELARTKLEAEQEEKKRYYKERAKIRTDRKLRYEKQGGLFGTIKRQTASVAKRLDTPKAKTIKRRKKKGKKRKSYARQAPPQRPPKKMDIIGKSWI